ncbi:MAG: prepilin-type N-terminal cleavage/methylation domain-containing protein [Kangiellaceae bacterium]|nr:prepilin-type N-terminal cleavage/methylation domain-containing protein [Kangiellaceae bacterium]
MKSYPNRSKGFTLIELIVVIVILGIMAAIAGPKFVDLQKEARVSVMNGVEGAVRSTATLVYSKSLIEGEESTAEASAPSVIVQGATVLTDFGYPTAGTSGDPVTDGLLAAMELQGDVTAASDGGVVTFTFTGFSGCTVTYTEAASAGAAPAVANNANTTNC